MSGPRDLGTEGTPEGAFGATIHPLERRYRRLLEVLPAEDRAARGEELLGLLLDLDNGRTRPSVREASGVVALGLRLRLARLGRPAWQLLARPASLLLSAFIVASCTAPLGDLIDYYTGGARSVDVAAGPGFARLAIGPAIWLAVAVAWVLGARRSALALCLAWVVYILSTYFVATNLVMVAFPAAMLVAVWLRLPAPRSRTALLAGIPVALLLWKLIWVWGRHGMYFVTAPAWVSWAAAGTGAAIAAAVTWRRGWRLASVGATAGLCAGWFAPTQALQLAYGRHSWLLSITVTIALLTGIADLVARRNAARPDAA
jgi:hypothetical protein